MSIYVDNMRLQARVGRLNARWSHMLADTEAELIEFAKRIGLQERWIQHRGDDAATTHFDLTESKRATAVSKGAVEVDWRDMGTLMQLLRKVSNCDLEVRDSTQLSECSNCADQVQTYGPLSDAANDELWLCWRCIVELDIDFT